MKKEREMKTTIYKEILIKSKAYKKLMKLMEKCLAEGGFVDFVHKGEKIDLTMTWERQEG